MSCGIYYLRSPSDKMYVGSSINCEQRIIQHFTLLKAKTHPSRRLSQAFIKYGRVGFKSGILEACSPAELGAKEQHWIDTLKPRYNTRIRATDNFGLRMSPEEMLQHSVRMKEYVEENPEFKAHLAAQNQANWDDPEKRAKRIDGLKNAWTPEKRAATSEKQKGVDKGEKARVVRWSAPGAREAAKKSKSEWWAGRPSFTEEGIRASAAKYGWTVVAIGGFKTSSKVTVRCAKHNHEGTPTARHLVERGQGCRFCGFERSSLKQRGETPR